MPVHHVYLSRFSDFFVSGAIPSPVMNFGIVANNLFEFHAFKPGHYISYKFYVDGIGGRKDYGACIHDFGSHIDLGGHVGITIRLYRHLDPCGLCVCA